MKMIKRIGGTSVRAITSNLLAVGYSSDEIKLTLNGQELVKLKNALESNVIGFIKNLI
jgi:hypothetical protein